MLHCSWNGHVPDSQLITITERTAKDQATTIVMMNSTNNYRLGYFPRALLHMDDVLATAKKSHWNSITIAAHRRNDSKGAVFKLYIPIVSFGNKHNIELLSNVVDNAFEVLPTA